MREHLVDDFEGFLGIDVFRNDSDPTEFTLLMLQRLHETVLARPVNKDSFRRRMLASGDLESTGTRETDTAHRPAELYRFARRSAV